MTDRHPRDITFLLKSLVDQHFLVANEKRRWSSCTVAPESPVSEPDSSQHNEPSSPHKDASLHLNGTSLHHKAPSLHHNDTNTLPSEGPQALSSGALLPVESLPAVVQKVRNQKRSNRAQVEAAILLLCQDRFVTIQEFAENLQRSTANIKNHYISKLIRQGRLTLRFPEQPTHPAQAYQTSATPAKGPTP